MRREVGATLVSDRFAEDLADFLFNAATMTACTTLELGLHVIVREIEMLRSRGALRASRPELIPDALRVRQACFHRGADLQAQAR